MRYIIKMSLYGSFPGSPDHNYFEVDEATFDNIRDLVHQFGRHDTFEEISGFEIIKLPKEPPIKTIDSELRRKPDET
jgi:hypothetical protein